MSHSRNAKTWEPEETASTARALPGSAPPDKLLRRQRPRRVAAHSERATLESEFYRAACRLFPGFGDVPAAFRATFDRYAPLLAADGGPLSLHEREIIARAVTGREQPGFGAVAAEPSDDRRADDTHAAAPRSDEARDRLIADFAVKVTRRWLAIAGSDVEQLLDAELSADAVRAIAETAAVFHFIAEVSAAMLLRPRL